MDSGREWFWHNYDVCQKWQEKHHRAYWRSKALALEYERDSLLDYVKNTSRKEDVAANDPEENGSYRRQKSQEFAHFCTSDNNYSSKRIEHNGKNRLRAIQSSSPRANRSNSFIRNNSEVDPSAHQESEVDKDVIEFFKQSMLHKMELKEKRKASGESDSATDSSTVKRRRGCLHASTEEEMTLLYGKKSAMIRGMETAVQLSFERTCDKLNPVYWPVIPLKS